MPERIVNGDGGLTSELGVQQPRRRPTAPATVAVAALVAVATLVTVSWLVRVLAHLDDADSVDHVAGTWIALAQYANQGTLYPPLNDGERFGGTRFMPVPILVQALGARISGEYVTSAKVLSAVLVLALASLTFGLLRRRVSVPVALALSSTLLVSGTGLVAGTSIRNDALPLLLQLGAVALVASSRMRIALVVAGVLCALAVLSKLSAVWAPIAIVSWLGWRDRRALAPFASALVLVMAAGLATAQLASDGRFADNLLDLSTTSTDRLGSPDEVVDRIRLILREGLGPLVVLPLLAVIVVAAAAQRREIELHHVAFLSAGVVTIGVLLDPGAYVNHLLDAQVLSLLVIAGVWRRGSPRWALTASRTALGLTVVLTLGIAGSYVQNVTLRNDLRALVEGTDPGDRVPRLGAAIRADEDILSEDPFVPASRDDRPAVLDAFMLINLFRSHPEWQRDLVRRIGRAEFDKIVLFYVPRTAPGWYERVHFGSEVVRAIERSYQPVGRVDGYWIYAPR